MSSYKDFKTWIPFFLVDYESYDIIVSTTVPQEVSVSKPINYEEADVPGRSYKPMQFKNMGATEVSFDITMVKKNSSVGAMPYASQFDNLRNSISSASLFSNDVRNPKVLYWYGTGTVIPLAYYVTKCDMKNSMYNIMGYPQKIVASMTLKAAEDLDIYSYNRVAAAVFRYMGLAQGISAYEEKVKSTGAGRWSQKMSPYQGEW